MATVQPAAGFLEARDGTMKAKRNLLLACLLVLMAALSLPAAAEAEQEAPERRIDLAGTREARAQAEADVSLDEDLRARILELYDAAVGALEAAAGFQDQAEDFAREKDTVAPMVESLRARLSRPDPEPRIDLSENATAEEAESALARERSRLSAHRSALADMEKLVEERANSRNEISRRLGLLDQEIESLADDLRTVTQRYADTALRNAARAEFLARRERASGEIEALRARLALLDARAKLTPWRIDQAQRRVDYSEQVVPLLEAATEELRHREAEVSLRRIRQECAELASESPALAEIAAEVQDLAGMLWGPDGVVIEAEQVSKVIASTRKHLADLDRIVQLTRRRFEAYGHRGSIQRWWPEIPEDFPESGEAADTLNELEELIPEVQHELIRLEQLRTRSRKLAGDTLRELREEGGGSIAPELRRRARRLLNLRRELLDDLNQLHRRYVDELVSLETVTRRFLNEDERVTAFLYEQLLWVRSVPRPVLPRPGNLGAAFVWLATGSEWGDGIVIVVGSAWRYPARSLGLLALFILLLGSRRWMRHRLARIAERMQTSDSNTYGATLEAFLYTILLAVPLPLALYIGSRILLEADTSVYLFAAGEAMALLASIAALMTLSRQVLAPNGLAEVHFRSPTRVTRLAYKGLLWREALCLPLIFIALHFVMAGGALTSPETLQAHNNSLGRVVFIIAMTILGLSLVSLFRPRKRDITADQTRSTAWSHRLYIYAYPVILLTTLVPALLAALGYYITGLLLAYQMLRTLWLFIGILIAGGMLMRWRATQAAPGSPDGQVVVAHGGKDLPEAEAQVRKLFRFALVLVAAVGLYGIWSQALPTLQILRRVQVWPTIRVMESAETQGLERASPPAAVGEAPPAEGTAEGRSTTTTSPPALPFAGGGEAAGSASQAVGPSVLTLWKLLEALLATLITVVLVRNLPGLLELTLRRRTRMDSGARVALSTLARYTIMILGVSISLGFLGISWNKIQWLAAALTFGLGFGLQEIVANFVSGLILLMERPVRVGDAVTVGNLQGIVSRIRIRATTITLWDQSEMIVPNKEFVTTKLVNWTLSDSRRRIEIPIRIAYGTDLQKVKEIAVAATREVPNVLEDPAPHVLLLEFGDDAVKFELRFFVDFGKGLSTRDAVQMAVDRVFREEGIEFAPPLLQLKMPGGEEKRLTAPPEPPATEPAG
jgi:potassium efflux system protein